MIVGAWWQDQFGLLQVPSTSSRYFIFVAYVKLYCNNFGCPMSSRYLEIVIILGIVIFGDKEWKKNKKQKANKQTNKQKKDGWETKSF